VETKSCAALALANTLTYSARVQHCAGLHAPRREPCKAVRMADGTALERTWFLSTSGSRTEVVLEYQ
jgi:hypothetical protein